MQVREQDFKNVSKQIGRRIQQIRKAMGMTQAELEERSEVYDVGAIERGEMNPTLLTLLRLATALNVELKELFDALSVEDLPEQKKVQMEVIGLLSKQKIALQRKALELVKVFLS